MNKSLFTKIFIGNCLIISFFFSNKLFSQSQGTGIFFQAVARDNFANPAKDRKIYIQSTIIQGTENGTKALIEEHQSQTDPTGVFSISLGQGTRKGGTAANLASIDWVKGPYFLNLKIAIKPIAPVTNWDYTKELIDLGTTPFGTVPYALYSASSGALDSKLSIGDTSKMLAIYAKAQAVNSLATQVVTKLSATDTATMLAPYAKMVKAMVASNITSLTAAAINAGLDAKVNIADSGVIYITPQQLKGVKFDTTSLIARVDTKVSIADSGTTYVTPMQLKGVKFDTTSLIARVDKKISYSDSITQYVTPAQLASKTFDSSAIYNQLATKLNKSDTLTLSNRINLKAASADVNSGLALKLNKTDTSYLLQKADTTTLSNRINLKAASVDVSSGLALKLNKTDTSYLLQKADTSTLSNRINLKANTTDVTTGLGLKLDADQRGVANGVASLDINSKVPAAQIPVISFASASVVANEAAMLALSGAIVGSIAIRTDANKNFVLSAAGPSVLSNWVELATPTSVTSINGFAGPSVTVTTNDINEGATNKYYTDNRARNAISASAPLSYNVAAGTFSISVASTTTNGYLSSSDFTIFNNKQNALVAGTDYATPSGNITGNAANVTGVVSIIHGGTGTSTATGALINLGAESTANKSTAIDLGNARPSDTLFPSQKAVKTYVDAQTAAAGVLDGSITNAKLAGSINSDKLLGSIPASKLVGTDITTVGTITSGIWSGTTIALANGGTGATTAAGAKTNLGLVIGTDVLAYRTFGTAANNNTADFEVPLTFTSPLSRATNTISIPAATTSVNGYLSSTDWTTFNAKQTALTAGSGISISAGTISATGLTTSNLSSTAGITNSQLAGSIDDSKLAIISTGGKVANSATTATNANTASAIVARDASGNFSANIITGTLSGTASTVTTNANLTGDVTSVGNTTTVGKINGTSLSALTTGILKNTTSSGVPSIAIAGTDYQAPVTLTTTGTSGASTFTSNTLNIPTYTLAGLGGISLSGLSATAPLSYNNTSGEFSMPAATTSANGYLSSADWTTFNAKQTALTAGSGISISAGTISATGLTTSNLSSTAGITNAQLAGSIDDSKLAIISTGGKVANSATTATNANTASAIVARDASGNFSANIITGTLSGTATNVSGIVAIANGGIGLTSVGTNGQVLSSNGTSIAWSNPAATGITAINGITTGTQTLTVGTTGTAPAFSSSSSTHTLNIPMASTTSVTAGLLSKSDYDVFNAKQTALTAGSGISISAGTISATGLTTSNLSSTAGITNTQLAGSIAASKLIGTDITTVGTITSGVWSGTTIALVNGGTGATTPAAARTNLGLAIGSDVLAYRTFGTAANSSTTDFVTANASITSATKTKLTYDAKGLITAGADATTADIAPSTDRNYVTDAQKSGVLSNTSGINTGDETASTIKSKLAITNLSGSNTGDQTITLTGDVTGTGTGSFTSTVTKINGTSLSTLATGILKNTTSTGVPTIAIAGTDYQLPISLTTTGSSGTATFTSNTLNIPTYTLAGLGGIGLSGLSATAPLSYNNGTGAFSIPAATSSANGYLSSTDWSTFNNKQAALTAGAGSGISISGGTISATGLTTSNLSSTAGITNAQLASSTTTLGSTLMSLGGTVTSVTGLSSVSSTGFTGALTGNASTATTLATARNINGTAFNGSADITIIADAGTLSGTTLKSTVISSSLTGVGTITSGTWNGSTLAVAYGGTGVTTSTGSGNVVLSTSPNLVTPNLGTPSSATLTNATGLPIATGVSGLGTGIVSFLATPTSSNLISAVTDETGTGALVFANTPTLVSPVIGAATGTSLSLTGTLSAGTSSVTSSTISGNETVGGTLGVTGATTLTALTTTGAATFSSTVKISTGAAAGKVLTSDASGNATWQNTGGTVVTMSATGTATSTATYIIFTGATASQTITIPSAVTLGAGREITIKNVASVTVSIASAAGYLIQDNSTLTSATAALGIEPSNNWMKLVSDGTNWYIFRALF